MEIGSIVASVAAAIGTAITALGQRRGGLHRLRAEIAANRALAVDFPDDSVERARLTAFGLLLVERYIAKGEEQLAKPTRSWMSALVMFLTAAAFVYLAVIVPPTWAKILLTIPAGFFAFACFGTLVPPAEKRPRSAS